MKFEDAQKILDGPDNAATSYFKDKTYSRLQKVFKPIVKQTMGQVGVTRQFQEINDKLSSIALADKASVDIDQYVTEKSLDGLFFMLAEEEKKIRQDPAARVTDILKKSSAVRAKTSNYLHQTIFCSHLAFLLNVCFIPLLGCFELFGWLSGNWYIDVVPGVLQRSTSKNTNHIQFINKYLILSTR